MYACHPPLYPYKYNHNPPLPRPVPTNVPSVDICFAAVCTTGRWRWNRGDADANLVGRRTANLPVRAEVEVEVEVAGRATPREAGANKVSVAVDGDLCALPVVTAYATTAVPRRAHKRILCTCFLLEGTCSIGSCMMLEWRYIVVCGEKGLYVYAFNACALCVHVLSALLVCVCA